MLGLLTAGWLLQERMTAPSMNDLDYSELYRFIDEGKVDLLLLKGQAVDGAFYEQQKVAGHKTKLFRATAPTNDPSFWPLLHEKKVRVQVIAAGPGLLTRFAVGAVPLALFLALGLWAARRTTNASFG